MGRSRAGPDTGSGARARRPHVQDVHEGRPGARVRESGESLQRPHSATARTRRQRLRHPAGDDRPAGGDRPAGSAVDGPERGGARQPDPRDLSARQLEHSRCPVPLRPRHAGGVSRRAAGRVAAPCALLLPVGRRHHQPDEHCREELRIRASSAALSSCRSASRSGSAGESSWMLPSTASSSRALASA